MQIFEARISSGNSDGAQDPLASKTSSSSCRVSAASLTEELIAVVTPEKQPSTASVDVQCCSFSKTLPMAASDMSTMKTTHSVMVPQTQKVSSVASLAAMFDRQTSVGKTFAATLNVECTDASQSEKTHCTKKHRASPNPSVACLAASHMSMMNSVQGPRTKKASSVASLVATFEKQTSVGKTVATTLNMEHTDASQSKSTRTTMSAAHGFCTNKHRALAKTSVASLVAKLEYTDAPQSQKASPKPLVASLVAKLEKQPLSMGKASATFPKELTASPGHKKHPIAVSDIAASCCSESGRTSTKLSRLVQLFEKNDDLGSEQGLSPSLGTTPRSVGSLNSSGYKKALPKASATSASPPLRHWTNVS